VIVAGIKKLRRMFKQHGVRMMFMKLIGRGPKVG
jgi:hypothetical protein